MAISSLVFLLSHVRCGGRCVPCGVLLSEVGPGFGPASADETCTRCLHRAEQDSSLDLLTSTAMILRDEFLEWCEEQFGGDIPELDPSVALEPEQAKRLRRCQVLARRCKLSQIQLHGRLKQLLLDIDDSPVESISEVSFQTHGLPIGKWAHCIFRIRLKNGSQYAFDPTGIQFGPRWALIQDWDRYSRAKIDAREDVDVSELGSRERIVAAAREAETRRTLPDVVGVFI